MLRPSGPTCLSCEKAIELVSLQVQLEAQIRECIAKYYEGWTVCSDSTCANRTRMMGLYGSKCLRQECTGKVALEVCNGFFSAKFLYTE
jgi:DNA polymerase alpha subunit A